MRVLVVEDDRELCELYQELLAEIGHTPRFAHTAEAALDHLRSEPADVVLLDICLPGMSGLDFLRLQAVRELRVPVIVTSGRATESQAHECLRLGAFDFIGKPVPVERLEELLGCLEPPCRTTPSADRRGSPRAPVRMPVRVRRDDGVECETTSVDLSASGVKLRSCAALGPGDPATLTLALPDGQVPLEVAAVLVHADCDGYAFRFVSLAEGQRERLRDLVGWSATDVPAQNPAPHLGILRTIGRAISASLDVDEVLRVALDALTRVTGHEIASLHLVSADRRTLHLRGDRGLRPHLREINRVLPVGQGVIGGVAATGRTVVMAESSESAELLPAARSVVQEEGIHAFVCVPIESRGEILGALSLGRRTRAPFTDAEVALVEASAQQIGLALENAQLYSETRRRLDDLKQAEAQLVQQDKLSTIGKLAAGLVHEIRNRLTGILGQAELLLRAPEDPVNSQERLQIIVKETSRAAGMLQNLLQFSRRESTERHPCRLEDQIRWALEIERPDLQRQGVRVVTELGAVPAVLGEEGQIQQVLLNLIRNASDAMAGHRGERVLTLRLLEQDARVRLEVLDTGPGIRADVLPRLCEAFVTTKPAGEGTGLGLWVSSAIIERHEGALRAANRPEGGAAFTLELPRVREGAAREAAAQAPAR